MGLRKLGCLRFCPRGGAGLLPPLLLLLENAVKYFVAGEYCTSLVANEVLVEMAGVDPLSFYLNTYAFCISNLKNES